MIKQMWAKIQKKLTKQQVNNTNWVTVFSTHNSYFSSIYQLTLEENGIAFKTLEHMDSAYNLFGEILFMVEKENVEEAQKILNSLNE